MTKRNSPVDLSFFFTILIAISPVVIVAQDCSSVSATYISSESRCAATGSVLVNATGGSGNYLYKAVGPVTTNFSSANPITALPGGTYLIMIKDLVNNCTYQQDSVFVPGTYQDFRFSLHTTGVTCENGTDGSITLDTVEHGRSPFLYSIVAPSASGIGSSNSTGMFTGLLYGDYTIQARDSCGGIQTRTATINNYNWRISYFTVTRNCTDANINIGLTDNNGNSTPAAAFDSFNYGIVNAPGDTAWYPASSFVYPLTNKRSLVIVVKDNCGNINSSYWSENKIPSVVDTISITNKSCSTFTAIATGASNLINPQYCLFDNNGLLVGCNTTGRFNSVTYGNYCIKITDPCYDTVITRCFSANKLLPSVDSTVFISNLACTNFKAAITGKTNLTNPSYCIFTADDVLLTCNTNGIFNNLVYGSYTIKIINDSSCYDTIIEMHFKVSPPIPFLGDENSIFPFDNSCNTFSVSPPNSNWSNPVFCLYNIHDTLIRCNTNGYFNNIPFGYYCIKVTNDSACYDTTMVRCFTGSKAIPVIGDYIFSNRTCSTFTATLTSVQHLSSPQFCLFDSSNSLLRCNTTGLFTNLLYGSYCIKMTNSATCYDTVIQRCFTVLETSLPAAEFSMNAQPSCAFYGGTDINVNIFSGGAPYTIKVLNPANQVVSSTTSNGPTTVYGLQGLPAPLQYKVIVKGLCSRPDSLYIAPIPSTFSRVNVVKARCPTGSASNGVSDLEITAVSNQGYVTAYIIKRDSASAMILPDYHSGDTTGFRSLLPGTYIIRMQTAGCNTLFVYDTVIIPAYTYPNLSNSAAYRCDNADVSIGASVTGGVAPFMYEIFESLPGTPNIVTTPQASPLFTFNTTSSYSLIRLRVVDACGNASINDLSIQPLGASVITASTDCFFSTVVLKADTIANATYTWYRKTSATDSVLVNTTANYTIPYFTPADTGWYVCRISVNNDCLIRLSNFHLDGYCTALPVTLTLKGRLEGNGIAELYWNAIDETGVKEYQLERKCDGDNMFSFIGQRVFATAGLQNNYTLTDVNILPGNNHYRLKVIENNGVFSYSNIVNIRYNHPANAAVNIYPNPVQNAMTIEFTNTLKSNYAIEIITAAGQKVYSNVFQNILPGKIQVLRPLNIKRGFHIVSVTNMATKEKFNFRITCL